MTRINEIEARLTAALQDKSFYLRVNTWLTAGDGRDFCAQAPDDIRYLIDETTQLRTELREAVETIKTCDAIVAQAIYETITHSGQMLLKSTRAKARAFFEKYPKGTDGN